MWHGNGCYVVIETLFASMTDVSLDVLVSIR